MSAEAVNVGPVGRAVAANVRRLRDAQGLTTIRLSALLTEAGNHIPATGITRIEKGERRVHVDELVALAPVFRVEPADLLSEEPSCRACNDDPPKGFTCNICGGGASRADHRIP